MKKGSLYGARRRVTGLLGNSDSRGILEQEKPCQFTGMLMSNPKLTSDDAVASGAFAVVAGVELEGIILALELAAAVSLDWAAAVLAGASTEDEPRFADEALDWTAVVVSEDETEVAALLLLTALPDDAVSVADADAVPFDDVAVAEETPEISEETIAAPSDSKAPNESVRSKL